MFTFQKQPCDLWRGCTLIHQIVHKTNFWIEAFLNKENIFLNNLPEYLKGGNGVRE